MARKLSVEYPGAVYHVMNRGDRRDAIFRLLLCRFGARIGSMANGPHPRPATLWRVTVESWLRCQAQIVIRQNQNVSPTFSKIWIHN